MKKHLIIQIIALIIVIIGFVFQVLDRKGVDKLPDILKGTGMWIVIVGLFLSSFSLLFSGIKKKN